MITHVVLFRPKASLTSEAQTHFVETLRAAIEGIPEIARARVGRRITFGAEYEKLPGQDYPFIAILEFADRQALTTYLAHPAHRALGQQFYSAAESALALDYAFVEVKALLSSAE